MQPVISIKNKWFFLRKYYIYTPRELSSVGRTMHNICKVWGSNPGHHKKNYYIHFWLFMVTMNTRIIYARSGFQTPVTIKKIIIYIFGFFFCGGRDSNPKPYIFYALSIPTELSPRGYIFGCLWLLWTFWKLVDEKIYIWQNILNLWYYLCLFWCLFILKLFMNDVKITISWLNWIDNLANWWFWNKG